MNDTLKNKSYLFFYGRLFLWLSLFLVILPLGLYLYFIPLESRIRGCLLTKMFKVELCPGSKNYVPLNKISKNIQWAVITSEDGLFYQHDGFDWGALEASFQDVLKSGKYKRGGSTISQQLAKNMFLTKEKTLFRKFREALITWKIERTLTKGEILERYLNVIEFGQGIYGIKKATQYYFDKSPFAIDPAEAAFLAMILPSPHKYARSFRKKDLTPFAKRRISSIVNNMYRSGHISRESYEESLFKLQDFFGVKPDPLDESLDLNLEESEPLTN
jgi:monofunctional biosynthetic peptidoglycan transglycosylase